MSDWSEFYENRTGNAGYFEYFKKRYAPMIEVLSQMIFTVDELCQEEGVPLTVVEQGCGLGNMTMALMDEGMQRHRSQPMGMWGLRDKDLAMLSACALHFKTLNRHYRDVVNIDEDDILQIRSRGQIMHSHGVLEHFSQPEISRIMGLMKTYSLGMVHYVPTDKYKVPSFGDENLWSVDKWVRLCRPDWVETFNDGHDLMMVWDRRIPEPIELPF